MIVGYHAPHEQYPPRELLGHLIAADRAGFRAGMCSDHLAPFTTAQGNSGFAWTWLGAALQATSMTMGVVSCPGYRYHPAVLAQAAATCAQMFPDRFWMALGSGEALNEHVTGEAWPAKPERNARLEESAQAMRTLLAGGEVTHEGRITLDRARLWSLPERPPRLLGAALSEATAAWVATWADGLITVNQPDKKLRNVVQAFQQAGASKRMVLQAQVSWHPEYAQALQAAHTEWSMGALSPGQLEDLATPADFDAAVQDVPPSAVTASVEVLDSMEALASRLAAWEAMGFDAVHLHNVGRNQGEFIREAARHLDLAGGGDA